MAIISLDDLDKLFVASNVCRFTTPTATVFGDWVNLTPLLDFSTLLITGDPNRVLFINADGDADTNANFTYNEVDQELEITHGTSGSSGYVGYGVQFTQTDSIGGSAGINLDNTAAKVSIYSVSSGLHSLLSSAEAEAVRIYSAKSTGSKSTELRIIPDYAFLSGSNSAGLNIGATDSPLAMLEVQEDFLVTSATANQSFKYTGTGLELTVTGTGKIPLLSLMNNALPLNKARVSFIQDEEDCGGVAIRNASGDEAIKMDGNDLLGHSFFMNRHFSVGRDGVTATYGGVIDGALFTVDDNFHMLDASTDYSDPNNYLVHLKSSGATGRVLAMGFTDAAEAEVDTNIGAAISFHRTHDTSAGSLQFRTKTSTTTGVAPALALTIDQYGNSVFTGAVQVGVFAGTGVTNPTDGMIIYDSSAGTFKGRASGSWVNLH